MRSPMPNFLNKKVASSKDPIVMPMSSNNGNMSAKKNRRKDGEIKGKPWHDKSKENKYKEKKAPAEQPMVTPVILARNPMSATISNNDEQSKKVDVVKSIQVASKPTNLEANVVAQSEMKFPAKMLDETLGWCEDLAPYLLDQSDFFVVGVIGCQGSGKSTICSYLADATRASKIENAVFKIQSEDQVVQGVHSTEGIDAYITKERVIILDVQPLLSPSVMEMLVLKERKGSNEYNSVENLLEIESFQLLTMVMSVCHAMLLVQDYIMSPNLLRMLHACQMLKPTYSHSKGREGVRRNINFNQPYYPHLVFVHNRADPQDFQPKNIIDMQNRYQLTMGDSCFYIESQIGVTSGTISPTLNVNLPCPHLNLFLIPDLDREKNCPLNLSDCLLEMRRQLFSLTRSPITNVPMTEKSWFQFCGKMWDTIRKSNLYQEYCKLLP